MLEHARRTMAAEGQFRAPKGAIWDRTIVLANRAPVTHERSGRSGITATRSASGLVTALEPLVDACAGVWVGHASGTADMLVADDRGRVHMNTRGEGYDIRYVPLPEEEHRGYYYGFANEGLWPLCHAVDVEPAFQCGDFRMYSSANARFAAAVRDEVGDDAALVLVQDYHFALAPRLLRQQLTSSTIVTFWHIPWPDPRALAACPWARELLEGLLGSHILGFQTAADGRNFLRCAASMLDARVDRRRKVVRYQGRTTEIRTYPVGVEWGNRHVLTAPSAEDCRAQIYRELQLPADVRLGVGIDRLDYTKGLEAKCQAIERALEDRPELRGRMVFVQVAEPSRECLSAYQAARAHLRATAARVNERFGTASYTPIVLLEGHQAPADVYRFYRAADFCYVGSLRDGMNLVAKEFVCARDDERGVLILSRFAGAARQLRDALIVDPYAPADGAAAIAAALTLPDAEQSRRMRRMRSNVARFDARWWAGRLFDDARRISAPSLPDGQSSEDSRPRR